MPESNKLPFNFAMSFNTQDESSGEILQEQLEKPFCIAMMGNFGGRLGNIEKTNISDRNFIQIDRYNYDEVLASIAPELSLPVDPDSKDSVKVLINSLKDFIPDKLYKNVSIFARLRDIRNRLKNPDTFKQALQELEFNSEEDESQSSEQPQPQSTIDSSQKVCGDNLLDSIVQETESRSSQVDEGSKTSKNMVDAFIKQLATRDRKNMSPDPRQDELVASIDEAIAHQMRSVLHNPQFQALEAAWRGVHFMVKRIPANKKVKLYLLDISQDELASDLNIDDATQTQLYQQFCDTSKGDISWNLIIGDYRFGADIDDMLTLSQMGIIAQQAGAQFIAAADEKLVGCVSFSQTPKADNWTNKISEPVSEAWTLLRKSPVARNICLALPRFMLRAPYGSKATPVKTFAFEEISESPHHEDYLWGNPAFFKAEQYARAFIESGWKMQYKNVLNTEDLPVHYYQQGGQTVVKPCAEIALTDSGASKMIVQGLIPLWSVKNSDRVHSGDFHSIAE